MYSPPEQIARSLVAFSSTQTWFEGLFTRNTMVETYHDAQFKDTICGILKCWISKGQKSVQTV